MEWGVGSFIDCASGVVGRRELCHSWGHVHYSCALVTNASAESSVPALSGRLIQLLEEMGRGGSEGST